MEEGLSGFCIQAKGSFHHAGGGNGGAAGTKCGRWNPTAEQVKVLTELFRAGLRTPTTDQIQRISAQLSFYGKIESKNVFYWFQNHKARERQKRRRVCKEDKVAIHCNEKIMMTPSPKCFGEKNQVSSESNRVIETLQLFPLTSYDEPQAEKLRNLRNDYKENAWVPYSYAFNAREIDHPPLDLRLSFV